MSTHSQQTGKAPCLFVNHGGGPMPLMGRDPVTASLLSAIPSHLHSAPSAILVVSAHWEAEPLEVTASSSHSLLFDYYGFPSEAYEYSYPAPGSPALAEKVRSLLSDASLPATLSTRSLDHGSFVPLLLAYPEAHIPVVALSLSSTLSPAKHLAIGRAIAPLREENVLILGSGQSFHNMAGFNPSFTPRNGKDVPSGSEFNEALVKAVTHRDTAKRNAMLERWEDFPGSRFAHPREEHLLPLLVVTGASGNDCGTALSSGPVMGAACSSFGFGTRKLTKE